MAVLSPGENPFAVFTNDADDVPCPVPSNTFVNVISVNGFGPGAADAKPAPTATPPPASSATTATHAVLRRNTPRKRAHDERRERRELIHAPRSRAAAAGETPPIPSSCSPNGTRYDLPRQAEAREHHQRLQFARKQHPSEPQHQHHPRCRLVPLNALQTPDRKSLPKAHRTHRQKWAKITLNALKIHPRPTHTTQTGPLVAACRNDTRPQRTPIKD